MNRPRKTNGVRPGATTAVPEEPAWSVPRLRVGEEGERRATWLELFFDLVFAVAIATLASFLHDKLTPGGFFGFALLLVPVGWVWMSFAYYADQFDTDDTLFRVVMLVATLAFLGVYLNPLTLVGLLELILVGLTAFEVSRIDQTPDQAGDATLPEARPAGRPRKG